MSKENSTLTEAEKLTASTPVCEKIKPCPPPVVEPHTHEFLGSTRLAGTGALVHNHRFAGVTTAEIPNAGGSHVHSFEVNTDSTTHFHEVSGTTGPAIILNPLAPEEFRRHIHIAIGNTTESAGHTHVFIFGTLIENPSTP